MTLALSWLATACTGAPEQASFEVDAAASGQALTLEDCASQRDACFAESPVLGLLTCPAQYTQCTAAVASGIPREVASAVQDARECVRAGVACTAEAGSPLQVAECAEDEAQCVAAIVDIELPRVVEGTAECVRSTVDCLEASETRGDVADCGSELRSCAVEQAVSVVPPEVAETISDVVDCNNAVRGCVAEASNAEGVTECAEREAACIANSLDVDLPDVPLSEVVGCAENAGRCALDANSIATVAACADSLRQCAVGIVEAIEAPQELTREQKWTVCVGNDPLAFLRCGAQLAGCED